MYLDLEVSCNNNSLVKATINYQAFFGPRFRAIRAMSHREDGTSRYRPEGFQFWIDSSNIFQVSLQMYDETLSGGIWLMGESEATYGGRVFPATKFQNVREQYGVGITEENQFFIPQHFKMLVHRYNTETRKIVLKARWDTFRTRLLIERGRI